MSPNIVGSPNSVDIVGSMLLMVVQTKECNNVQHLTGMHCVCV